MAIRLSCESQFGPCSQFLFNLSEIRKLRKLEELEELKKTTDADILEDITWLEVYCCGSEIRNFLEKLLLKASIIISEPPSSTGYFLNN